MAKQQLLLVVGWHQRNVELLAQFLNKEGYRTLQVMDLEAIDQALASQPDLGLVLIDIAGGDEGIWKYCDKLRVRKIPFLIFAPKQSASMEQESVSRGARAVLVKPLVMKKLISIIQSLLD